MIFGWLGGLGGGRSSARAAGESLTLYELESRVVPAVYLWHPTWSVLAGRSTSWSSGDNWQIFSKFNNSYIEQQTVPTFTPTVGDSVEFDGAESDNDCVVDVAGGVTVKNVKIWGGYTSNLILSNPLTVAGNGSFLFHNSTANVRGSAPGATIARGTLTITDDSTLYFTRGNFADVTIDARVNSKIFVGSAADHFGQRTFTGSDIYINDTCRLIWQGGDVTVINRAANSHVTIMSGGEFNISANNFAWGMNTPTDPAYFGIHNAGLVTSTHDTTIIGNYDTTGTTRLESGGTLSIFGLAEQTSGTFELRDNSTIRVGGPDVALRIYGGMIAGNGTVDANLTLCYDSYCVQGGSTISPGIDIVPASPGAAPIVRGVGTITVKGNFQMFGGDLTIDIAADGSYDQVLVQGKATLSGSLLVRNDDKYKPMQAASLNFLTAGSIAGDFFWISCNDMTGWTDANGETWGSKIWLSGAAYSMTWFKGNGPH